MKATCSSCGASILWTVTEAGRRMPVDATPAGKVTVLVKNPHDENTPISKVRDHYLSHFINCPNSAAHRTKKTQPSGEQDSPEEPPTDAT